MPYGLDTPVPRGIAGAYGLDSPLEPVVPGAEGFGAGELERGLHRGLSGIANTAQATAGQIIQPLAPEAGTNIIQGAIDDQQAMGQHYAPAVPTWNDVRGIGDSMLYGAGKIGEMAPIIPLAMTGAGLGRVAIGGAAGSELGGLASFMPQTMGGEAMQLHQDPAAAGMTPAQKLAHAALFGGAEAGIGAMVPAAATERLLAPQALRGGIGAQIAGLGMNTIKGAAAGGAGMAAMDAVGQFGRQTYDPNARFEPEALKEAAIGGFAGTVPFAGAHAVAAHAVDSGVGAALKGLDVGKKAAELTGLGAQYVGQKAYDAMPEVARKAFDLTISGIKNIQDAPEKIAEAYHAAMKIGTDYYGDVKARNEQTGDPLLDATKTATTMAHDAKTAVANAYEKVAAAAPEIADAAAGSIKRGGERLLGKFIYTPEERLGHAVDKLGQGFGLIDVPGEIEHRAQLFQGIHDELAKDSTFQKQPEMLARIADAAKSLRDYNEGKSDGSEKDIRVKIEGVASEIKHLLNQHKGIELESALADALKENGTKFAMPMTPREEFDMKAAEHHMVADNITSQALENAFDAVRRNGPGFTAYREKIAENIRTAMKHMRKGDTGGKIAGALTNYIGHVFGEHIGGKLRGQLDAAEQRRSQARTNTRSKDKGVRLSGKAETARLNKHTTVLADVKKNLKDTAVGITATASSVIASIQRTIEMITDINSRRNFEMKDLPHELQAHLKAKAGTDKEKLRELSSNLREAATYELTTELNKELAHHLKPGTDVAKLMEDVLSMNEAWHAEARKKHGVGEGHDAATVETEKESDGFSEKDDAEDNRTKATVASPVDVDTSQLLVGHRTAKHNHQGGAIGHAKMEAARKHDNYVETGYVNVLHHVPLMERRAGQTDDDVLSGLRNKAEDDNRVEFQNLKDELSSSPELQRLKTTPGELLAQLDAEFQASEKKHKEALRTQAPWEVFDAVKALTERYDGMTDYTAQQVKDMFWAKVKMDWKKGGGTAREFFEKFTHSFPTTRNMGGTHERLEFHDIMKGVMSDTKAGGRKIKATSVADGILQVHVADSETPQYVDIPVLMKASLGKVRTRTEGVDETGQREVYDKSLDNKDYVRDMVSAYANLLVDLLTAEHIKLTKESLDALMSMPANLKLAEGVTLGDILDIKKKVQFVDPATMKLTKTEQAEHDALDTPKKQRQFLNDLADERTEKIHDAIIKPGETLKTRESIEKGLLSADLPGTGSRHVTADGQPVTIDTQELIRQMASARKVDLKKAPKTVYFALLNEGIKYLHDNNLVDKDSLPMPTAGMKGEEGRDGKKGKEASVRLSSQYEGLAIADRPYAKQVVNADGEMITHTVRNADDTRLTLKGSDARAIYEASTLDLEGDRRAAASLESFVAALERQMENDREMHRTLSQKENAAALEDNTKAISDTAKGIKEAENGGEVLKARTLTKQLHKLHEEKIELEKEQDRVEVEQAGQGRRLSQREIRKMSPEARAKYEAKDREIAGGIKMRRRDELEAYENGTAPEGHEDLRVLENGGVEARYENALNKRYELNGVEAPFNVPRDNVNGHHEEVELTQLMETGEQKKTPGTNAEIDKKNREHGKADDSTAVFGEYDPVTKAPRQKIGETYEASKKTTEPVVHDTNAKNLRQKRTTPVTDDSVQQKTMENMVAGGMGDVSPEKVERYRETVNGKVVFTETEGAREARKAAAEKAAAERQNARTEAVQKAMAPKEQAAAATEGPKTRKADKKLQNLLDDINGNRKPDMPQEDNQIKPWHDEVMRMERTEQNAHQIDETLRRLKIEAEIQGIDLKTGEYKSGQTKEEIGLQRENGATAGSAELVPAKNGKTWNIVQDGEVVGSLGRLTGEFSKKVELANGPKGLHAVLTRDGGEPKAMEPYDGARDVTTPTTKLAPAGGRMETGSRQSVKEGWAPANYKLFGKLDSNGRVSEISYDNTLYSPANFTKKFGSERLMALERILTDKAAGKETNSQDAYEIGTARMAEIARGGKVEPIKRGPTYATEQKKVTDAGYSTKDAEIMPIVKNSPKAKHTMLNLPDGSMFEGKTAREVADIAENMLGNKGSIKEAVDAIMNGGKEAAGSFTPTGKGAKDFVIKFASGLRGPAGSTIMHEVMHGLFHILGTTEAGKAALEKITRSLTSPIMRERITRALDSLELDPRAQAEIQKAMNSDREEAAAYAFQLYTQGILKIGETPTNIFGKMVKKLREFLGITREFERTEAFLDAFMKQDLAKADFKPSALEAAFKEKNGDQMFKAVKEHMQPFMKVIHTVFDSSVKAMERLNLPEANELIKKYTGYGEGEGFIHRVTAESNIRSSQVRKIMDQYKTEDISAAITDIYNGKTDSEAARQIKSFMESVNTYAGRDKDHLPTIWDFEKIGKNRKEFDAAIEDFGKNKDEITTRAVLDVLGDMGYSPHENDRVDFLPAFNNEKSKWIQTDPSKFMRSFIVQSVKHTEHQKIFGKNGQAAVDTILSKIKAKGGAEAHSKAQQFVDGMEGRLGQNMNHDVRQMMKAILTAGNVITLPLSIFSAMIDPFHLASRSSSLGEAGAAYAKGVGSIFKSVHELFGGKHENTKEEQFAEDIGAIEHAMMTDVLGDIYLGDRAEGWTKKVNDWFFKANMLDGWTRQMRVAAVMGGQRFILAHSGKGEHGEKGKSLHSDHYMEELGLKPEDVEVSKDGNLVVNDKIKMALNQFVDESIVRPDASTNAIWMNDPRFMLLSHMKRFTFAFNDKVLNRVMTEMHHGNIAPLGLMAASLPVTMLTGMGRHFLKGNYDTWMNGKSWGQWFGYMMGQSGMNGKMQFGLDAMHDVQGGGSPFDSAMGPDLGLVKHFMGTPHHAVQGSDGWIGLLDDAAMLAANANKGKEKEKK